ncbi:MAG: hypothetical protein AAB642_00395 [Patescibacteria group bacterium]
MANIKLTRKSARTKAESPVVPLPGNSWKPKRHPLTQEELLNMLVDLCESYGRPISRDDVKAASRDGIIPSEQIIRRYLGAVDIAVIRANKIFKAKCS